MHEDDRIVEQGGVLHGDELGMGLDANVQIVAGLLHQIRQGPGSGIATAGVLELGDGKLARSFIGGALDNDRFGDEVLFFNSRLVA